MQTRSTEKVLAISTVRAIIFYALNKVRQNLRRLYMGIFFGVLCSAIVFYISYCLVSHAPPCDERKMWKQQPRDDNGSRKANVIYNLAGKSNVSLLLLPGLRGHLKL